MFHSGKLLVRPLTAQLAHDKDLLGKMDPYCVLVVGGQTFKSSVAKSGGKTPSWTDTLTFTINNDQVLIVRLFDKDRFSKDDYIAECAVPLAEVYQKRNLTNWYNVSNKGKLEGKIMICCEFVPNATGMNQGFNQGFGPGPQMHNPQQNFPMPPGMHPMQPGMPLMQPGMPPMQPGMPPFGQPQGRR